ncbi:MAG: DUF5797 family protein [Halobaculum sp.]
MTLTDEERDRLADVVELQPTTNGELGDRWGMDSGSEVHGYLEDHLGDYYYRDDDSYIRATAEAADLVDVEPGVADPDQDGNPERIRVPRLQAQVFDVIAGPDERSQSVVSVLRAVREVHGVDPTADEIEDALKALRRKGVVEVIYRTVPTYRLAVPREDVDVSVTE